MQSARKNVGVRNIPGTVINRDLPGMQQPERPDIR